MDGEVRVLDKDEEIEKESEIADYAPVKRNIKYCNQDHRKR